MPFPRCCAADMVINLIGLGGVASPLLCQSLIAINVPWFKFYLASLVLSAVNVALLITTFKPTEREYMRDRQHAIMVASKCENESAWVKDVPSLRDTEYAASEPQSENVATNKKGTSQAFRV